MTEFLEPKPPRIAKWPFFLGDAILVAVALLCYGQGSRWPFGSSTGLHPWEGWVLTACLAIGACLAVIPFILEYRVATRMDELDRVQSGLQQIKNIEQVARQINSATSSWQAVQDDAGKVVASAQNLQAQMAAEAQAFQEFLQRAHDTERSHLRLEVDKLRRSEAEWLQTTVRILDHVWALYRAAVLSGKVNLVGQLSLFQRACRDAAQRVGIAPVIPTSNEHFDPNLHQTPDGSEPHDPNSPIHETLATGFRFQGQLVRKALVTLQNPDGTPTQTPDADPNDFTSQLASDFRDSADTAFFQAMQDEGLPQPTPTDSYLPPAPAQPQPPDEEPATPPAAPQVDETEPHPNDLFRRKDDPRFL
jgi:molecular chaperone GrpE (heat shock protein)